MPKIEKIFPEYIRLDGETQPRTNVNQAICDEYGELMKAGVRFPPVDVFYDGESYWLADGFHRVQAYMMALPGEAIECNVYKGSLQDAQWHSYSVNKTHGIRRTNADKERAVRAALVHPAAEGKSNLQIAEHCGVSEFMVRKYLRSKEDTSTSIISKSNSPATSASTISKSRPRKGRDGRTINTANIGKSQSKRAKRKAGKKGVRISKDAAVPVLGHSLPNPMISLSLPPKNPVIAAATIFKLFDSNFVRALIAELTQRLQGENQ